MLGLDPTKQTRCTPLIKRTQKTLCSEKIVDLKKMFK